jgi:hypothetical protein
MGSRSAVVGSDSQKAAIARKNNAGQRADSLPNSRIHEASAALALA